MCVIVYKKIKGVFSEEEFRSCWKRNMDGLGFAGINGEELELTKGIMSLDEALKQTEKWRETGVEAVFHFRLQSVGEINQKMTHPFSFTNPEDKERRRAVFHNGTIRELSPSIGYSDSCFAGNMLKPLSDKDVHSLLSFWNRLGNNRFVTVVERKDRKPDIEIYPTHESRWVGDIWFSNWKHHDPVIVKNHHCHC